MARYRIYKKGDDDIEVVGVYTPAKGGAKKLVVVRAKAKDLAKSAEAVARGVQKLRNPQGPSQDDQSEPGRGE